MNEIAKIFRERCINVSMFADMVGIPKTTIYGILCGKSNLERISITTWIAIARGLGMTADELYDIVFGGKDA